MEIVGEQSGTTDSTRTVSEGNEASVKKTKIMMTEEEQEFAKMFSTDVSKIDKPRIIELRHVPGRGVSSKNKDQSFMM